MEMLMIFGVFLYYLFLSSREVHTEEQKRPEHTWVKSWLLTIGGLVGLIVGGHLTVEGASGLALGLGISETLIALTVVAVGTSLPELAASIVAARKGATDIAIGGIVGSNIFDILLGLGASAVIAPMPITTNNIQDAFVVLASVVILLIALFVHGKHEKTQTRGLDKHAGWIFLFLYATYIAFIVIRG